MRGEPIRAAVLADTHGLLRPEVEHIIQACDVVIHAGDFDDQMIYHKLNIKQPLYGVRGNNDGSWAERLPFIRRFTLGGVRFIMAHERSDIPQDLAEEQVVVFGHSHRYYQQVEEGRLWLNPGSCGNRRFTLPLSLAVVTLQEGTYEVEPVWLEEEKGTSPGAAGLKQTAARAGCRRESLVRRSREPEEAEKKAAGLAKAREEKERRKLKERDQLFVTAKAIRLMKRGGSVNWVAENLKLEPGFVETVYRIALTHPGADARQILDKLEVNRLFEQR